MEAGNKFRLFDSLSNGIVVINGKLIIEFWNKNLEYLTGITSSEVLGKDISALFPNLNNGIYRDCIKNILAGGPPTLFSSEQHNNFFPFMNIDSIYHTMINSYKEPGSDDFYAVLSVQDVTFESRQINDFREMRCKLKAELKEKEKIQRDLIKSIKSRDKFYTLVSHDLKSPFHGMLGITEILSNEIEKLSREEIKVFSHELHQSLTNYFKFLNNLLEWTKIQSGRIKYEPDSLNVFELVNEVCLAFQSIASKKKLHLINHVEPGSGITADRNIVYSVLQNIISNAVKFSKGGGKVTISAEETSKQYSIIVSDEGVGMELKDLKKLMHPESHFSQDGTWNEKGTGLGLLICKELMDIHNGELFIESQLNKGSVVTVLLKK